MFSIPDKAAENATVLDRLQSENQVSAKMYLVLYLGHSISCNFGNNALSSTYSVVFLLQIGLRCQCNVL